MSKIIDYGQLGNRNEDKDRNNQTGKRRNNSVERTKFLEEIKEEVNSTYVQERPSRSHVREQEPRRLTAKKGTVENALYKQIKNPKLRKAVAAVALVAVLVPAGLAISSCVNDKQPEGEQIQTIEQAIDEGETLDSLGLSQETIDKLTQLEESLSNSAQLTDSQLVRLSQEIDGFALDSAKEKIMNELGLDENVKITFNYEEINDRGKNTNIIIDGKTYKKDFDFGTKLASDSMIEMVNKIGSHQIKISSAMSIVEEAKEAEEKMARGEDVGEIKYLDRQSFVEQNQEFLKAHEEFLSGDISIDQNGNLQYMDVKEAQRIEEEKNNQEIMPVTIVKDDGQER